MESANVEILASADSNLPAVHPQYGIWRRVAALLPGLAVTGLLAFASIEMAHFSWARDNGISALTLAIVLGMLVGNSAYPAIGGVAGVGVNFSKANLLRLGIILYGLRLTFQDIANVGWAGVLIDAAVISSTFGLAWVLGTRVFGLDQKTVILIGAGSSICGAAAVMAAEPVAHGRAEHVTVAVATVVVFGTLAMFLYPVLHHLNDQYHLINLSSGAYGLFAGSTIHEVAQVVVAARAISEQAANTAVIAKMVRVMMLAPFLVILSAWLARRSVTHHAIQGAPATSAEKSQSNIVIPWFALGFIAVAGIHSLPLLGAAAVSRLVDLDTVLLAMAMAGLGLTTHFSVIRKAGLKPIALATVLFVWLVCGGLAINMGITAALH